MVDETERKKGNSVVDIDDGWGHLSPGPLSAKLTCQFRSNLQVRKFFIDFIGLTREHIELSSRLWNFYGAMAF